LVVASKAWGGDAIVARDGAFAAGSLTVRFGGITALDAVSSSLPPFVALARANQFTPDDIDEAAAALAALIVAIDNAPSASS
jgi:hypothetical protein